MAHRPGRVCCPLYNGDALVGRDIRIPWRDVLQRQVGRVPRIRGAPDAHDGEPRAGDLPRSALRGMARASRASGLEDSRGVGCEGDAWRVQDLPSAINRSEEHTNEL